MGNDTICDELLAENPAVAVRGSDKPRKTAFIAGYNGYPALSETEAEKQAYDAGRECVVRD